VVGLGAVGGFYGARLAVAGHEVHFVARSDAEHVREHGLLVESPDGDIHLRDVSVHRSPETVPDVDVVVLAVKTTDTARAVGLLDGLVGDDTLVLVLQNGLGVEARLADAVPGTVVLGGMCFLCSNKVGPGHIRHLDYGRVTVGEHDPGGAAGRTANVEAVVADLIGAGVAAEIVEHLAAGRWRKLVWNIPYNGLSVVLDAGTDELMADPDTRRLVEALMHEVAAGSGACGHEIEADFIDRMLRDTEAMAPYKTSMKLDHEAGRPLELDAIYAAPIVAAAAAGYAMVRTEALWAQLSFLDRRAQR